MIKELNDDVILVGVEEHKSEDFKTGEITKFLKFNDVNSKDLEADETIRNNFRDQLNS